MPHQHAPYRADIVGSFLRPLAIKQARQQFADGEIYAPLKMLKSVVWCSISVIAAYMW